MSAGLPTRLVRDGHAESYDEPPSLPLPDVLEPVDEGGDEHEPADGSDLHRADEVCDEPSSSAQRMRRAAIDFFEQLPRR